ncbi:MAG: hypothetical protein ACYS8X_14310 [Planctomycetota bacterium]|jgi:hypothetical protein
MVELLVDGCDRLIDEGLLAVQRRRGLIGQPLGVGIQRISRQSGERLPHLLLSSRQTRSVGAAANPTDHQRHTRTEHQPDNQTYDEQCHDTCSYSRARITAAL